MTRGEADAHAAPLTDDALAAMEARLAGGMYASIDDVPTLIAEVRRLRAAEAPAAPDGERVTTARAREMLSALDPQRRCPDCGVYSPPEVVLGGLAMHDGCPAAEPPIWGRTPIEEMQPWMAPDDGRCVISDLLDARSALADAGALHLADCRAVECVRGIIDALGIAPDATYAEVVAAVREVVDAWQIERGNAATSATVEEVARTVCGVERDAALAWATAAEAQRDAVAGAVRAYLTAAEERAEYTEFEDVSDDTRHADATLAAARAALDAELAGCV